MDVITSRTILVIIRESNAKYIIIRDNVDKYYLSNDILAVVKITIKSLTRF